MDSSLHAIQTDLQWLTLKESEMLRNNSTSQIRNPETEKQPYPVTFMLSQQESPQLSNQMLQRRMLMNNQKQPDDLYSNSMEYNTNDARANYIGNLPGRNFVDFNYGDGYGAHMQRGNAHHHSLISTSPMPVANAQLPFNSLEMYAYHLHQQPQLHQQQQQQCSPLHSQMSPNMNGNYYRSMNIPNENKENQMFSHQAHNEQFYLHKPSDNAPFQFHSASPNATNLNYATSGPTNTFNQRKSWDSQDDTANTSSLQPTPPPRMYTSR
jgi:hypothetical protein